METTVKADATALHSITISATNSSDLIRSLNDAVQLLPPEENEAYFEALRTAPSLVHSESNPVLFVRFEEFNVWNAAKRIALYWKVRKELFGEDNFLKPMHITGNGALNSLDIKMLETGVLCPLPKTSSTGRPVLWWDREKLDEIQLLDLKSRARVLFYMIQVLMTGEDDGNNDDDVISDAKPTSKHSNSSPGFVMLANFPTRFGGKKDFEWTRKVGMYCRDAFAVHTTELHLVMIPSNRATLLLSGVVNITTQILTTFVPSLPQLHTGTTVRELQLKLLRAGFEKRNLPPKLGGNWKVEKFEQFLRRRRKIEEELFLTVEEKLIRKRQINMIHSRQKRERRKIEYEVLQNQCDSMTEQKSRLQASIERYERLIALAKQEIGKYEGEVSMSVSSDRIVSLDNHPRQPPPQLQTATTAHGTPPFSSAPDAYACQRNSVLPCSHPQPDDQLNILKTMLNVQQRMHDQQHVQILQQRQSLLHPMAEEQYLQQLRSNQLELLLQQPQHSHQQMSPQPSDLLSSLQVRQLLANQNASRESVMGGIVQNPYSVASSFVSQGSHSYRPNDHDLLLALAAQLQSRFSSSATLPNTSYRSGNNDQYAINETQSVASNQNQEYPILQSLLSMHPQSDPSTNVSSSLSQAQPQNDDARVNKSFTADLSSFWPW